MRPSTMAFVFALSLGLAVFVQPAAAQAGASDIIAVGAMAPAITVTGASSNSTASTYTTFIHNCRAPAFTSTIFFYFTIWSTRTI